MINYFDPDYNYSNVICLSYSVEYNAPSEGSLYKRYL